jgi:integrase
LDSFLNKAKKACQELIDKDKPVSALTIKNQMQGIGQNFHGIVKCFESFVKEIKLKIGSDYKLGTLKNYNVTLGHLKEFILKQYQVKDVLLKDLNFKFITEFELMCKTKWECKRSSTTIKHIQRIRNVIGIAIANEWLEKDPFVLYKGKQEKATIKFLTLEELKAIEEKEFVFDRLDRVRDMFIFSCYTGYAYADVEKFSPGDIATGMDGLKWIYTDRAKNESKSNVPLLPQALAIIEKYQSHPDVINKNRLLPVISNIKTND